MCEIMGLSCSKCSKRVEGTYEELFGDLPSLQLLPKLTCTCGGNIIIEPFVPKPNPDVRVKRPAKL